MDSSAASVAHDEPPGAAVIFGASGAIGGALVAQLLASRRYSAVHAGARDAAADLPDGARAFRFDLTDEASIAAAVASVSAPIRLVVVATGLLHDEACAIAPEKSWRTLDASSLSQLFAVNTIGPALIAKHALPRFPRHHRAILAMLSARVGSIADNRLGGWHGYRASKAALNMLVRNFAIELARTHPHAIAAALHPGTVESPLSAPFRGPPASKRLTPDEAASHLIRLIDGLTPADSGGLFAWDGARLPY